LIDEPAEHDPEVTPYLVWRPHNDIHETYQFLAAFKQLLTTRKHYAYAIPLTGAAERGWAKAIIIWGVHH
jgi:hypothetical protein